MIDKIIIVGGPRRGKSTISKAMRELGIPTYCTDPKSLVKDPEDGVTYLPEKFAEKGQWSGASQFVSDEWFVMDSPWVIEGVATVRALRKWYKANDFHPCDAILFFKEPHPDVVPTRGQETMAKSILTIWKDVEPSAAEITTILNHETCPGWLVDNLSRVT